MRLGAAADSAMVKLARSTNNLMDGLKLVLEPSGRGSPGCRETVLEVSLIEDIIRPYEKPYRLMFLQRDAIAGAEVDFVNSAEAVNLRHNVAVHRPQIAAGRAGVECQEQARSGPFRNHDGELILGHDER